MKRKCVFSIVAVITLAVLSDVTFASSLAGMPEDKISEQRMVSETAAAIEPETITEPKQTVAGTAPAEKLTEAPYQSLAASMDWGAEESYLLAKIAMAEAESEDIEGKALVMMVVLNRVWDDKFPDSIEAVIYQSVQFSPIDNGKFDSVEPDEECWEALNLIMLDKWDESMGATYFESKSKSTWHSENLKFLFRHGNHYFYEEWE